MSDVTGPISTLPGTTREPPDGIMCDDHPDRSAVTRVQGETDSFGCEMIDMCAECFAEYKREIAEEDTSGTCDWCKQHAPKLRYRRDYEEGMYGRVYEVCDDCIKRQLEDDEEYLRGFDSGDWDE